MEVKGTALKPQGRERYCPSEGQGAASPSVNLGCPLFPRSAHLLPNSSLKFTVLQAFLEVGLPGSSPLWPQNMFLPSPGTHND